MDKKQAMNGKDILSIWKDRIENEAKYGDKTQACSNAGSTMTTYQTAMKKERFSELTDKEIGVLVEVIKILDARKEANLKLQAQYANQ